MPRRNKCLQIVSFLAVVWILCTFHVAKKSTGKAKMSDADQHALLPPVDGNIFQIEGQKLRQSRRTGGRVPGFSSTGSNNSSSPSRDGIKVLSFSVYGLNRRYLVGLIRIAMDAPTIYPGWQVRVYHPPDLYPDFKMKLGAVGDHVKLVDVGSDTPQWVHSSVSGNASATTSTTDGRGIDPTMWRFLVASDPTVSVYAIRDCDSVLSLREKSAVDEWLVSGKKFHIMHDHPLHLSVFDAAILAGMWGGRRDAVPQMDKLLQQYHNDKRRSGRANEFGDDQLFLWQHIVPLARNDCVHHDSYYCDESGGIAFPMTRIQDGTPYDYIGDAWFNLGKGGSGIEPSPDLPWAQKCLEIAENKARYQHCLKKRQDMEDSLAKMIGTTKSEGARLTPSSSYAGPSERNMSAVNVRAICH